MSKERATQLINSLISPDQINPDQYAFANVFTTEGNEILEAVSAYPVFPNAQVTAKIYLLNEGYTSPVDGVLADEVTKNYDNEGFYTLELNEPIALQAGQKFSVVENIVYTMTENDQNLNIPMFSLEYGLNDLYLITLKDEVGQPTGTSFMNITAKVNEGESYVYGLNGISGNPSQDWNDIADPEIYQQLSITEDLGGENNPDDINTVVPGNCMIKAYTTENPSSGTLPTGIQFSPGPVYLSTYALGQTSTQLSASILPSNATNNAISYSIFPSTVASVTQNGNTAQVTAVSEGYAKLIARTVNGYVATKDILVSNDDFIVGNVSTNTTDQDYLQLEIENLYQNPALDLGVEPNVVSVFVWSQDDMSDVQAVTAEPIPNTDNWITSDIGVNNTTSYLVNADRIKYVVYVGNNSSSQNMIFSGFTSWVQPGIEEQEKVSYISYNQNVGFVEPTLHDEGTAGLIGNPNSVHMEGLRVSSGIPGSISQPLFMQPILDGWIPFKMVAMQERCIKIDPWKLFN